MSERFPDDRSPVDHVDDHVQKYLRSMLTLEPRDWGTHGLKLRRSFVSPSQPESTGPEFDAFPSEPDELMRLITDCKAQFWSSDCLPLFEGLEVQTFEKAPELAQAAKRLLSWFRVRLQLQKLCSQMGDNSLAQSLHGMATMTAREVSTEKASIAWNLQKGKARAIVRQAKTIRTEYPEVYALDPDWFDELIAFKRRG